MAPRPHYNKDLITVVGTYFRPIHNDQKKSSLLNKGCYVSLEREPTNPHDQNAIMVKPHGFQHDDWIGYIPKEVAKDLAPILDRGSQYYCVLDNVYTYQGGPRFVLQLSTFPVPDSSPKVQPSAPRKSFPASSYEDPNSPTGKRFRKHTDIDAHVENHIDVSGVYVIWSRDYKCYVGQSKNIGARWKNHRYDLLKRAHLNDRLQRAWINNGANYFRFDLLESAAPQHLDRLEHEYIQKLDSFLSGYNGTSDGQQGKTLQPKQPEPLGFALSPSSPSPVPKTPPSSNRTTKQQPEEKQSFNPGATKERKCAEGTQRERSPVPIQGVTGASWHKVICDNHQATGNGSGVQWTLLTLTLLFLIVAWLSDSSKPPISSVSPPAPPHPNPEVTLPQHLDSPEADKDHALRLKSTGRWDELIDMASRWKDNEPESEEAWYLLGEGYLGLSKFPEALAAFRQVIQISPNNQEAWKKVATTYIRAGQPKVARDIARKMKKVDPQLARDLEGLLQ